MLKNNLGKFHTKLFRCAITCNRTSSEIFPVVLELARNIKHPTFREQPSVDVSSLPMARGTSSELILLSLPHPIPYPRTLRRRLGSKGILGFLTNTVFMRKRYFIPFSKGR